jgi:hypothetical protein
LLFTLKQRVAPAVNSSLAPVAAPRAQGTDKSGGRAARASRRATAHAFARRLRPLSAAPPSVPASQDACTGIHSPGKTLCLGGFWLFTRGQLKSVFPCRFPLNGHNYRSKRVLNLLLDLTLLHLLCTNQMNPVQSLDRFRFLETFWNHTNFSSFMFGSGCTE